MPTKTTKTSPNGAKKKPQANKLPKFGDQVLELLRERLSAIETNVGLTHAAVLALQESSAKPADPPPAEKWVPKVGEYVIGSDGIVRLVREVSDTFSYLWLEGVLGARDYDDFRPATSAEIAEHKMKEEARMKAEAEARELAMPLKMGAPLKYGDRSGVYLWPVDNGRHWIAVEEDNDFRAGTTCVNRHQFTVIP